MDTAKLQATAKQLRREIVKMITEAGSGHPGGSLSAADILTVLYFDKMNVKPEDPNWLGRDYFVLSKGHAAPALYSTLAMRGYFPLEELAKGKGEPGETAEPLPEPMLVFCYLPQALLHQVLEVIRVANLPPIPLKAVLTETNRAWDTKQLHAELLQEREAIAAQKAEQA